MDVFCFLLVFGGALAVCVHLLVGIAFDQKAKIVIAEKGTLHARFMYLRRTFVKHDNSWVDPQTGEKPGYFLEQRARRLWELQGKP